MATVLKGTVTENADRLSVKFTETTLAYSVNNTGGWGAPNPATSDALTATFETSKRNEDGTYTTAVSKNIFTSGFPSSVEKSINITAADAGYGAGAVFPDGIYKFKYTVTGISAGVPFTYSLTITTPLYGEIRCCFQKKALKIAKSNPCCTEAEAFKSFASTYLALRGAIEAYVDLAQNNLDEIQRLINELTQLCKDCGCQ